MDNIYNSPLELGLRALFILKAEAPRRCSLERLIYLDYLTTYSSDSELKLESLHPVYPLRVVELFAKRTILQKGLLLMAAKGLIEIECSEDGFSYVCNVNTSWFLDEIENGYSKQLIISVEKVTNYYSEFDDEQIKNYFDNHYKSWGEEFSNFFPYIEEAIR